jgi:hypothetical protein
MKTIIQSLSITTLLCLNVAYAATPECDLTLLAQAKLHLTEEGAVLVPTQINGHDVYLDLRIGSGLPLIRESSVELLGLKQRARSGGARMTYGGRNVTHYVKLEGMKIENFRFASRNAPVLPRLGDESLPVVNGRPVVGIIGSTIFRMTDAELNLAEGDLRLYRKFRCMGKSPVYWGSEAAELPLRFDEAGALVFTLELEGKRIEASLLMGGRDSGIDSNAAREYFGIDQQDASKGDGLYFPMSLTGPGFQIKDARIQLTPASRCKLTGNTPGYGAIGYASCVNKVPFALGTDLLRQLRIYISAEREKIFVTTLASRGDNSTGSITIVPGR